MGERKLGNMSLEHLDFARSALLFMLLIVLLVCYSWNISSGRSRTVLLGVLVFAAISVNGAYLFVNPEKRVDYHDVFHYYIGGKYYSELGTDLIYSCTVVAERESTDRFARNPIIQARNLVSYKIEDAKRIFLSNQNECHKRFTEQRWKAFGLDLRYFKKVASPKVWKKIFIDRGTNASPVWILFGGSLAQVTKPTDIGVLVWVDAILLLVGVGFVFWAFGSDIGLASIAFLMTCLGTRFAHVGILYLRYDWLCLALVGISLARKGKWWFAGACLGLASGIKIFPVVLFAGWTGTAVWQLFTRLRMAKRETGLIFGSAVALGLCGLIFTMSYGPGPVLQFAQKIEQHARPENITHMRVGLLPALTWRGELSDEDRPSLGEASKGAIAKRYQSIAVLIGLAFFVWLFVLSRYLQWDRLALLGFGLFPLLLQASYYYYVFLLIPFVLQLSIIAQEQNRRRRLIEMSILLSMIGMNALEVLGRGLGGGTYPLLFGFSVYLILYVCALFGVSTWDILLLNSVQRHAALRSNGLTGVEITENPGR